VDIHAARLLGKVTYSASPADTRSKEERGRVLPERKTRSEKRGREKNLSSLEVPFSVFGKSGDISGDTKNFGKRQPKGRIFIKRGKKSLLC